MGRVEREAAVELGDGAERSVPWHCSIPFSPTSWFNVTALQKSSSLTSHGKNIPENLPNRGQSNAAMSSEPADEA